MKTCTGMTWIVMLALGLALTAGCAKKPAATTDGTEQPVETQVQDRDVSSVSDSGSGITDQEVLDQELKAAAAALQRIHFDFDQFSLSPEARQTLSANADYLRSHPAIKIKVEGHCDERGSDEYNLALGDRRAQATSDYLVSLGISGSRLATISYGEEVSLDPASNETAWAKNRRAEFKPVR